MYNALAMYEIEIRGVQNKKEAKGLKDFLDREAKFEETFKRLSVELVSDATPEIRENFRKKMTFRIKKSDGKEKISLKYGDWRKNQVGEVEVDIQSGQILKAIKLFEELGFIGLLVLFWESWVYEYKGCEVKVSKFLDDYYMWEIEARQTTEQEAIDEIQQLAKTLGLEPITGEAFAELTKWQNDNIWGPYNPAKVEQILKDEFEAL